MLLNTCGWPIRGMLYIITLLLHIPSSLQHALPKEGSLPYPTAASSLFATSTHRHPSTPPPLLIARATYTPTLSDLTNPSFLNSILDGTSTDFPNIAFPTIKISYPSNGPMIGGIVGGICVLILGILVATWFIYSRRSRAHQNRVMNQSNVMAQKATQGPNMVAPFPAPGMERGVYAPVHTSDPTWDNSNKYSQYDPYGGQMGSFYAQPPPQTSINPSSVMNNSNMATHIQHPMPTALPPGKVILSANSLTVIPQTSYAGSSTTLVPSSSSHIAHNTSVSRSSKSYPPTPTIATSSYSGHPSDSSNFAPERSLSTSKRSRPPTTPTGSRPMLARTSTSSSSGSRQHSNSMTASMPSKQATQEAPSQNNPTSIAPPAYSLTEQ